MNPSFNFCGRGSDQSPLTAPSGIKSAVSFSNSEEIILSCMYMKFHDKNDPNFRERRCSIHPGYPTGSQRLRDSQQTCLVKLSCMCHPRRMRQSSFAVRTTTTAKGASTHREQKKKKFPWPTMVNNNNSILLNKNPRR